MHSAAKARQAVPRTANAVTGAGSGGMTGVSRTSTSVNSRPRLRATLLAVLRAASRAGADTLRPNSARPRLTGSKPSASGGRPVSAAMAATSSAV
ncbi:hypothetical protein G6F57_015194 [Rhizopus arrhizus]|nr:hypothetical protein G6F57_015194 [Rhizopus arrhizus]